LTVSKKAAGRIFAGWHTRADGASECPPATGAESWFRFPGQRLHFHHQPANNTYRIQVSFRDCQIDAELHLADAAPELLAVGNVMVAACMQR
jgi:hypothetical protein